MAASIVLGGCLCGAVRYEATGEPYNITHCHCADCRKSSGAPFVTWVSFRRHNFRFTHGTPREIAWAGRVRSFLLRKLRHNLDVLESTGRRRSGRSRLQF